MSAFKDQEEYKELRRRVGVERWHDAGCLGQGLNIFCDDVGGGHVELVKDILETILPGSVIYTGNFEYRIEYGDVVESWVRCETTGELLPFDDFMTKYKIRLINNSTTGYEGAAVTPVGQFMADRLVKYNMIMTGSAGNGYGRPINTGYYGAAIIVTSVRLSEDGVIVAAKCAQGEGIDFSMFYGPMPGTSFSAPFLMGLIGLVLGRFPGMTQGQMYDYLTEHCMKLGKSKIFGNGMPVLPEL